MKRATVLWEDQRGVTVKGFGPHDLLMACVADELGPGHRRLADPVPLKGSGNVRKRLKRDVEKLRGHGPVVVVLDRDRVADLCVTPGADCMKGITSRLQKDAPGDYELVFLVDNTETLVAAACTALGIAAPNQKPTPDERDRYLGRAAWAPERGVRDDIRTSCPSFARLVEKLLAALGAEVR